MSGQKINAQVEAMYDVGSHPTFLFLDGNGKELARFSGAAKDVDKFVAKIEKYTKKENWRETQKQRFIKDKSYADKYVEYIKNSYLRDEFEFAYNTIYDRLKGNKDKQKEFLKKNVDMMALWYFKDINGSIFRYLYNNKEEFKALMNFDDQKYMGVISGIFEGAAKKMVLDGDYSEKDYKKLEEILAKYPMCKQRSGILFKAIKPAKEKGLDGIVEVYEKEVFKMKTMNRTFANYFFLRNYSHMVEKNAKLKNYLKKCYDMDKGKRGASIYKDMLGL